MAARRNRYWCWRRTLLVLALAVSGCQPDGLKDMVPIRGTVMSAGQPLKHGTVLYVPLNPEGRQARGEIGPDGTYRLTTLRSGDGAQHGDYGIVVLAYKAHPGDLTREEIEAAGGEIKREFAISEKYTNGDTSGLKDHVDDTHSGVKDLELEP